MLIFNYLTGLRLETVGSFINLQEKILVNVIFNKFCFLRKKWKIVSIDFAFYKVCK